jgi:hypothetical protein
MTQGNQNTSGRALRRKVRLVTVGVMGAAALATAGVTVGLAHAATDTVVSANSSATDTSATDTSATDTSVTGSSTADTSAASSSTGTSSADTSNASSLTAAATAPAASSGQSQVTSGGS